MKKAIFSSLGIDITISVPETIDEFNALDTTRPNAALDESINNVIYRDTLADFRDIFSAAVAKETTIARKQEQKKDSKGVLVTEKVKVKNEDGTESETEQPVMVDTETDAKYFSRVCSELGVEPTAFQTLAEKIAADLKFNPQATERATKQPSKVAEVYLKAARDIIAKGVQQAVALKLAELVGAAVEPTEESLGRAIQLNEARKRAAAQKQVAATYANLA